MDSPIQPARLPFRTELLIKELYERDVTIRDIFAQYYEMEAIGDHLHDVQFGNDEEGQHGRTKLTVEDAHLAGHTQPEIDKKPF